MFSTRAQNETYAPRFATPWRGNARDRAWVTMFTSPETSGDVARRMVEGSARTLDAYAPSVDSWSGCSRWSASCVGCDPDYLASNETFLLFRDLINAANRGVHVRLLTNKFDGVRECAGKLSVLSYLSLIFEVRTYRTTTFQHAKVLIADGETVSISSVNWSRGAFFENREAGVAIANSRGAAAYVSGVFEYDWQIAEPWTSAGISDDEVRRIRDGRFLEPFEIERRNISEPHYEAWPLGDPVIVSEDAIDISVSPDAGAETMMDFINVSTRYTLDVYTYQITDDRFADAIIALALNRNVRVRILLSRAIFSDRDRRLSIQVVDRMRQKAKDKILFLSSPHFYRYAHLKIMISDATAVAVATGNLSPSDLPFPVRPFPPHEASINRDFEVIIRNDDVVERFARLFEGELELGTTPYRRPSKF